MSGARPNHVIIVATVALLSSGCSPTSAEDLSGNVDHVLTEGEVQDAGLAAADSLRDDRSQQEQWQELRRADKDLEERRRQTRERHGIPTD